MHSADSYFNRKLELREELQMLRRLQTDKASIDFSSNDYLGLAQQEYALTSKGSTGSRLLSGNSKAILQLEAELASFYHASEAILFPTGFQANIGLLSTLGERSDTYLIDSNIHASMKSGARISSSKHWKFEHNNLVDLEQKLAKAGGKIWVFIEALYSMSGSIAPLQKISDLCEKYEAFLIVDEAHSNGIYGKNGEGLVSQLNLERKVTARVMTFGKAFGAEGAVVLGSKKLKDYLVNYCHSFIYSTAPSSGFINSLHHQLDAVKKAHLQRNQLFKNIHLFRSLKKSVNFQWTESSSPIQSLIVGEVGRAKQFANFLRNKGFYIFPILSPTVPLGKEQIRFCLHSFNTSEEINLLFQSIQEFK
ncbi:MAG: pyridoxal phosphate-dependent aminotransferase family protein [Flavobacteriales bacterium]|nr:pyridoxal phosphate-dependent aminotransferase family protein [Flavobacteriales bacterium]